MTYKELKDFVESAKYNQYWTAGMTEHKNLSLNQDFGFIRNLINETEFAVSDKNIDFLKSTVPEEFFNNDELVFHFKGIFWTLSLKDCICKPSKDQPDNVKIYDLQRGGLDELAATSGMIIQLLEKALNKYHLNCAYHSYNYAVIEKVDNSDKYDPSYSLTKDRVEKMNEWQTAHMNKYHKKWYKEYHGASPVSPFEIKFGTCSLGSYADCECTLCKKEYEKLEKENTKESWAKAKKLLKNMNFEVMGIE